MPEGLPIWAAFLALLLTGGTGAALFQYMTTRTTAKANRNVTNSTSRLTDVTSLEKAITTLSAELDRSNLRVKAVEEQNSTLETRIDTLEEELDTQRKRRHELERHLAMAENKIATLETQVINLGGKPDGVT